MALRRPEITRLFLVISILIIIANYFFNVPILSGANSVILRTAVIIAATASVVALINAILIMIRRIMRREKGHWYFAVYGLIMLVVTVALGLYFGPLSMSYLKFYLYVQVPLYCAMTGLLIFFITTATYRAFRARTIEALLLLLSGLIVLLGNAPFSETISPIFSELSNWILTVPNEAASRGMTIGAAIGIIGLGLRVLLGEEKATTPGG
jgi:hypothetical protein